MRKSKNPGNITVCQMLHSLNVGGAEILAMQLGRNLSSPTRRFVYFCLDDEGVNAEKMREAGFIIEFLHRKPGYDKACVKRIAQLWRKYRVDVVQAHQCTPFFYALAARGFFHRKPPILLTEHGRFFPDVPNKKHQMFHRMMLSSRDRITAVSRSVGNALIVNEGLPENRIEVVYNGVSERFLEYRLTDEQKAAKRAELGVGNRPIVLCVARLDPIKDHPTAIKTIHHLLLRPAFVNLPLEQQPILLMAGGGPEYEGLHQYIIDCGMEDYARLLGERSDIPELLQTADVFLLTSVSEGVPLTILEAYASETPVVATKVGGIPEILQDEKTGLVAPVGNEKRLAFALERLLTDPEFRRLVCRSAKESFLERFTEDRMLMEYAKILSEMLRY